MTSSSDPRTFPVVVVPYDSAWPGMYEAECSALRPALADVDPEIEHVGSTAVPGLAAKPKIDILVGLRRWEDLDAAVSRLSGIGYEDEPQIDVPRHRSMKRGHPTTHRVHLVERHGAEWWDVLTFRDALRADADLCDRYGRLKLELAVRHRDDHGAYSAGKGPFIRGVIRPGRPATVVEHDPAWVREFEMLRARLAPALAGIATAIEHVGSTAVSGLAAKPIVDMDVVMRDATLVPTAIARLEALGYEHQGDRGVSGREAFRPPTDGPYHHLYVVVDGTRPHRDHVDLRDYLGGHPDEAARYAARKRELAPLLTTDREAYLAGKAAIVEELLARAREKS